MIKIIYIFSGVDMSKCFPFAGKKFRLTLGDLVVNNHYSDDGKQIYIEFLSGELKGLQMNVDFSWKYLSDNNYLISWQESDQSTVVHCDNFVEQKSHAFYTTMKGEFFVLEGDITPL